jgi:cysteine synthase A
LIHDSVASCVGATPLVRLRRCFPDPGVEVIAKLDLLNPGGSVKDRPARHIVEEGLRSGRIRPGTHLIESTSGNLGIALAMIGRVHGLPFTAVVDPRIAPANLRVLRSLGAGIEMVDEPDLEARLRRVGELLEADPGALWINQYACELNWRAHYELTAGEILADLDAPVDYLVAAVSTTGTIVGLARRLRREMPDLCVVAVDAVGSVIFGGPAGARELPGIGSSRVPELLDAEQIDEVVHVDDREAAVACRRLASSEGVLAGGSSGSVVAAIGRLLERVARPVRMLTLLPDRGERYLDLVYDEDWLARLEPAMALR